MSSSLYGSSHPHKQSEQRDNRPQGIYILAITLAVAVAFWSFLHYLVTLILYFCVRQVIVALYTSA
jgi:hypothetical protein